MDRILTWLCMAVLLVGGGYGAHEAIDNTPAFHWAPAVLFWHPVHIDFPGGTKVHLAEKNAALGQVQGKLVEVSGNVTALRQAVSDQNDRISSLSAQAVANLAEADRYKTAAAKAMAKADEAKAFIQAHPPQGIDFCARVMSADDTFLETLQ